MGLQWVARVSQKKQKPNRHFSNGSPAVFKRSVTFRPQIAQGLAFSIFILSIKDSMSNIFNALKSLNFPSYTMR
jgi:hypothetical protein